jgi:hypothetical protein
MLVCPGGPRKTVAVMVMALVIVMVIVMVMLMMRVMVMMMVMVNMWPMRFQMCLHQNIPEIYALLR